jgi:hypothetical protein
MAEYNVATAEELARDIRSGMTDFELTEKYKLTLREFHLALAALIDSGLVTRQLLEEIQHLSNSQMIRAFVEDEMDDCSLL